MFSMVFVLISSFIVIGEYNYVHFLLSAIGKGTWQTYRSVCVLWFIFVLSYFSYMILAYSMDFCTHTFIYLNFDPFSSQSLSAGTHLFCVYGDNWFQSVRYTLRCLVAVPQDTDCVETIKSSEEKLAIKKKELEKFQSEFCEIKKKYDAAKERLETDVKEITEFIQVI